MWHKVAIVGLPGSGKTTMGLSYPGVEQHCWGSDEEITALNFMGRTDILPAKKWPWFETLTIAEQEKFRNTATKPDGGMVVSESDLARFAKIGRSRNVARYRRYLRQLAVDLQTHQRPELQTVLLDNFAPFTQEFEDYTEIVYEKDFTTREGGFDNAGYYKRFASEIQDFLHLFMDLPCHTIITSHISMIATEESAASMTFFEAAKKGGYKKEWQPLVTGKSARNAIAAIPGWAFFLQMEESPGQPSRYVAKLEADEKNIGVAKPRIQPWINPRRLEFPKNQFYQVFEAALTEYLKTGKPVVNP